MNITIHLEGEVEQRLREEAAKKELTLEAFIEQLVQQTVALTLPTPALTGEAWEAAFRAWVASHSPVTWKVDDDRESIYAGRGE